VNRALKILRNKLVNLLLKDVEIEELIVKKIEAGERTIIVTPDYIDMAALTADPALAAGRAWFRSDLGRCRYSPNGVEVISLDPPPPTILKEVIPLSIVEADFPAGTTTNLDLFAATGETWWLMAGCCTTATGTTGSELSGVNTAFFFMGAATKYR